MSYKKKFLIFFFFQMLPTKARPLTYGSLAHPHQDFVDVIVVVGFSFFFSDGWIEIFSLFLFYFFSIPLLLPSLFRQVFKPTTPSFFFFVS